jgi:hypothetical protein
MIKAGCSAHGGDEKCKQISIGKPEGKRHMGVDGRIILKCILEK